MMFFKRKSERKNIPLSFVFINDSILLTRETLEKNGYYEIWSQESGESKQILTFNEEKQDFIAYDKFIYMNDKALYLDHKITDTITDFANYNGMGGFACYRQGKELWTPIKFHNMTIDQLRKILGYKIKVN